MNDDLEAKVGMSMNIRSIFIVVTILLSLCFNAHATVRFAHITDLHIFEDAKRNFESKISASDFYISIKKINEISKNLKDASQEPLAFVLLSGDIGVGKLLKVDPKVGKLVKDPQKWNQALSSIAKMMHTSNVKKWLIVPGNNDLFEEQPTSVVFYRDFLKELQDMPNIKDAGISIIDFRLDASQQAHPHSQPGMYVLQDFVFVGWDNSYFKNNNSVKNYIGKNDKVIPVANTLEYQSVQKLSKILKECKAKYAFIFYHIPEIDDPYLIQFNEFEEGNVVSKRLKEARDLSPLFAKGLYPYSAWTVPLGVRKAWEETVTNTSGKGPIIKGLFAGHFHDHKKETYLSTLWLKTKKYKDEILDKLYVAPPFAVKNQTHYPPPERATGGQIITIGDKGTITRELFWFD